MTDDIRIAIVDDHPLVREGLVHAIEGGTGFAVVGLGESAADAAHLVAETRPDILILDLHIDGTGLQVLRDLGAGSGGTRVLVLTVSEDEFDLMEALRHGASGYALKGISGTDLRSVLHSIHRGGTYVAPTLGARILASISRKATPDGRTGIGPLSKRESDIYGLIRKGYCNKEIGRSLNLSEKTVKHYLTNMFRKMKVRSRMELALMN